MFCRIIRLSVGGLCGRGHGDVGSGVWVYLEIVVGGGRGRVNKDSS